MTATTTRKRRCKPPTTHLPQYRPSKQRKDKGFTPPGECVLVSEMPTTIRRDRMCLQYAEVDLPGVGRINFETLVKLCQPASKVFTPNELAARLEAMSMLAQERKPLFPSRDEQRRKA